MGSKCFLLIYYMRKLQLFEMIRFRNAMQVKKVLSRLYPWVPQNCSFEIKPWWTLKMDHSKIKKTDRHWQELHKGDKKASFSKQHTFSASCVTVKFERLQLLHIWLSSLLYTDQERYKNQGLKTKYKKNFLVTIFRVGFILLSAAYLAVANLAQL